VLHDSPDSNCINSLEDFIESSVRDGYRFEVTI